MLLLGAETRLHPLLLEAGIGIHPICDPPPGEGPPVLQQAGMF